MTKSTVELRAEEIDKVTTIEELKEYVKANDAAIIEMFLTFREAICRLGAQDNDV